MATAPITTPTTETTRWIWAGIAFVVVLATAAILGPLAVIGVIAGLGALVGTIAAFAIFGYALGSDPTIQEFVRTSEPHPEARLPYDAITPMSAATAAFIGVIGGMVNLGLSTIGGLIVGLLGEGSKNTAA